MNQETQPGAPARSLSLDALRGFALFGIILVNAPFFAAPLGLLPVSGALDAIAVWFTGAFAAGKFFLMFSFLFGFGFATILSRAGPGAEDVKGRFMRRLLALFAFGALHAWLLFLGDILMLYALLGLILWVCRDWPKARLLRTAAIVYGVGVLLQAAALSIASLEAARIAAPTIAGQGYLGGFMDAATARLAELPDGLGFILIFNGAPALAMFLAGLAFGRDGAFPPKPGLLSAERSRIRRLLLASATASGLAMATAMATSGVAQALGFLALAAVAPFLSLALAATVLDLAEGGKDSLAVRALAKAGGGSLSGYILHSVLLGALYHGWGLGLYGSLGPAMVLLSGIATFAAVVLLLNLWRGLFRYGPDEWLLRSFIDLRLKPILN